MQATSVHTTFVTGMLTEFAVGIVRWILSSRRAMPRTPAVRGVAEVAGLVWSTYAVGAVMGAWLVARTMGSG